MKSVRVPLLAGAILLGAFVHPAVAQVCEGRITIDANGTIQDPGLIKCDAGKNVRWRVVNNTDRNLTVSMVDFTPKDTGAPKQPSNEAKKDVNVDRKNAATSSQFKIKDKGDFPKLPVIYKYTITARDRTTGQSLKALDPDLEVTPPPAPSPMARRLR